VSGTGALTPVPNSPFPAGTVPFALVWNGSLLSPGNLLYAIDSSDGTISGYSINSTNGVLTPVSGFPFSIAGLSMATDSFGQYLYVASPIGIQAFAINISSGALTPSTGSPFAASGATLLTVVQIPPP
jgi:hypothetical protein